MNLIDRLLAPWSATRASPENPATSLSNPASWLLDWASGRVSRSGVRVTEETSMRLSAVYACVRVLSGLISMLPVNLYERQGSSRRLVSDHPMHRLLHAEPNAEQTPYFFHQTIATHALLWGNGFAAIMRGNNRRPEELIPMLPSKVRVARENGQVIYTATMEPGRDVRIAPSEVIHIPALGFDGLTGISPVAMAREAFAMGIAAEDFGASFFGNGAHLGGVLEHPLKLGDSAARHLRESWQEMHTGLDNAHRVAILEEGMKYSRTGIPPQDAQFLETRKFQISEVCRMFGVPPHLVADLERATFSNIEQQDLDVVRHTLMPWIVRFEQEYNRKLLLNDERGRLFFKFNADALLRGDSEARGRFYRELFNVGALSQNDIRAFEDMNPVEGGDRYFVPLNMVPIDSVDDMIGADDEAEPEAGEEDDDNEDDDDQDLDEDDAARARIESAYMHLFRYSSEIIVKREASLLTKAARLLEAGDAEAFSREVTRVYRALPNLIARHFTPVLIAVVGALRDDPEPCARALAVRVANDYIDDARRTLHSLPAESRALTDLVAEWKQVKPAQIAQRELRRAIDVAIN